MKKFLLFTLISLIAFVSCEKYDDSSLKTDIKDLNNRVTALENWQQQVNGNISSLQSVVNALNGTDHIVSVSDIVNNDGKVIGCSFQFAKGGKKEIYFSNEPAPAIGVKIHSDGIYYWTLNGDWLLDKNGNKIKAQGLDGKDGVTPILKIIDKVWHISYDNGQNWEAMDYDTTGDSVGPNSCIFKSVSVSDSYITFVLADNTSFAVPVGGVLNISFTDAGSTVLKLNSVTEIGYEVSSSTNRVDIEVIASSDLIAEIVADDESNLKGKIKITTGSSVAAQSKIVIIATNGNKVIMRSLSFEEEKLEITDNSNRNIDSNGGEISLEFLSNIDYDVIISDDAKSWISLITSKAVTKQSLSFNISKNTGSKRSGTITIQGRNSNLKLVYYITQGGTDSVTFEADNGIMPGAGRLTAEFIADYNPNVGIAQMVDNDANTYYEINDKAQFSFIWEGKEAVSIEKFYINFGTDISKIPAGIVFYGSNNGVNWDYLVGYGGEPNLPSTMSFDFSSRTRYKYIKLEVNNTKGLTHIRIHEFKLTPVQEVNFTTFEDVVKYASDFTYTASTPMGIHFANKHITTDEDKIWLSTATNEPSLLGSAPGYTLREYDVTLYPFGDPVPADVNQHGIGDCSALAVFAEMAYLFPDFIKSIITDNGDKTYTVKMFDPQGKRVDVAVQSTFLGDNNGIGAATGKNGKATWATILEKAIMKWNYIYQVNPDIYGIGSDRVAPLFTGEGNSFAYSPNSITTVNLKKAVDLCLEEKMIVIGGFRIGGLMVGSYQTVTAHAYSFMYSNNSNALFAMRNPWGYSPGSSGSEDGILDITDDGTVPPTIDLRVIYPGIAKQYAKETLSPYIPPQW